MTPLPVLYSFRRCPYAMRARMALIVADQPCELREVLLSDKPQAMLDISPKGTVPVLLFPDGTVIDESLDIMLWALNLATDTAWLRPDVGDLDAMLELVERNDTDFKHHLDRYKYPNRYEDERPDPLAHRGKATAMLQELEIRLGKHTHLFGPKPALADIAIFPFVRQFAAVEPEWFDNLRLPQLHAWLNGWLNSELFAIAMRRNDTWSPGQPTISLC